MEWIGCTVCEIFAFKLYCDLKTGVLGHSRSSKVALFDRAHHMRLYILFCSKYASIYYRFRGIAAYWSKIATPCNRRPRLGEKPLYLRNIPDDWRKTRMMRDAPIRQWKNFDNRPMFTWLVCCAQDAARLCDRFCQFFFRQAEVHGRAYSFLIPDKLRAQASALPPFSYPHFLAVIPYMLSNRKWQKLKTIVF